MAKSLTGANTIIMLAVTGIFDNPQQLQGFAADDVFNTESLQSVETLMGVDGKLSGGYVFVEVKQGYTLQADSGSIDIFDQWFYAQQTARDTFKAQAVITLKSVNKKFTMTNGFLTGYMPIPDNKKLIQPQKFGITWESVSPSPV